jgi:hypothetical protein
MEPGTNELSGHEVKPSAVVFHREVDDRRLGPQRWHHASPATWNAELARECLDAGLLDEIVIDLVPVVLGDGIAFLRQHPQRLEDPEVTVAAGVTHVRYRVKR